VPNLLLGDREVEWSWVIGRIPKNPGIVLDFGPATSFTPLAALMKGADEVIAVDQIPNLQNEINFSSSKLQFMQMDLLENESFVELSKLKIDLIINCSSIEHVGLSGRYGSKESSNGDIDVMRNFKALMLKQKKSKMILTIPIGQDKICKPFHRIYGLERLPKLLEGFTVLEEEYFSKESSKQWHIVDKEIALSTIGASNFYSIGLFVLEV
jgi:hypothetical protein